MSDQSKKIENIRREYARRTLTEDEIADDAIEQFARWFREALSADLPDANAMTMATVSSAGAPSARIVLLKGFDSNGFRFYTNYNSRKARELEKNAQAAVCFYWSQLERQVRIEGTVKRLSKEESARYFAERPRQSQLGAWASSQSKRVASREELERDFAAVKKRFKDKEIPLPDFWGGYLLRPRRIEFWQGRRGRLHDRIVFEKGEEKESWAISRLSP